MYIGKNPVQTIAQRSGRTIIEYSTQAKYDDALFAFTVPGRNDRVKCGDDPMTLCPNFRSAGIIQERNIVVDCE